MSKRPLNTEENERIRRADLTPKQEETVTDVWTSSEATSPTRLQKATILAIVPIFMLVFMANIVMQNPVMENIDTFALIAMYAFYIVLVIIGVNENNKIEESDPSDYPARLNQSVMKYWLPHSNQLKYYSLLAKIGLVITLAADGHIITAVVITLAMFAIFGCRIEIGKHVQETLDAIEEEDKDETTEEG